MTTKNQLLSHLKIILGNHVESGIVEYINSMKHQEDLEEFFDNILDKHNSSHMSSYEAISRILFGGASASKNKAKGTPINRNSEKVMNNNNKSKQLNKGKKRFSDINTFQEKKKQQEGRTICDCEGQEHEFMNNCLNCGRIHCFEEGPGPCFFCKEPVTLMGEEVPIEAKGRGKKSAVIRHKENTVFDDDNDYFKTNSPKKPGDKRKMVVALDFATRKVIESTEEDMKIKQKLHDDIKKHLVNVEKLYRKLQKQSESTMPSDNNDLVDLLIQMRHKKPAGVEDLGPEDETTHFIDYGKVYDEDVITNADHGLCLSMHQPYASLLIAGVKKHEGRTWKTNHRGRLWIAAAAKVPDEDEISALETFYRQYYEDETLKFPRDYPTSCLLGCVFVEDCVDQETYRRRFPGGESSSPYVLICSNPIILPIFYPIIGQHKIYPLDKELHNCAKLSIRHAKYGVD